MNTPRPDRDITRIRAQEAWAKLRRLQEPEVGSRHVLAGDGGVSVDLAGTALTIGRVSATGRPIIALNPTRRVLGMGQALEVLPMGETAPATWRVPPVRIEDVYWVSGAVLGQTPGLFTPAHQLQHGTAYDVAPHPTIPYDFYVAEGGIYHVTADGTITLVIGGGSTPSENGNVVAAIDATFSAALSFAVTPSGNGVMCGLTGARHDTYLYTEEVPFLDDILVYQHWVYDYDELQLYSYEPGTATVRNIRVRLTVGYHWKLLENDATVSDDGPPIETYPHIGSSPHFTCVRYNPVIGELFLIHDSSDPGYLVSVPWAGATTPPGSDTMAATWRAWPVGLSALTIAFDAAGLAYVAATDTFTGGTRVWLWDYNTGGVVAIVGDGISGGTFPADGTLSTSGDIGSISGLAFDALGRLLITCPGVYPAGPRLAAVDMTTGIITTLTGFGRPTAATENLVEPMATAVFTGMTSLQTDAAGRPYIGGEQVKRIGA